MQGVAIIAAAGKGTRAGEDKLKATLRGRSVLEWAAEPFFLSGSVNALVIVTSRDKVREVEALFAGRSEKPVFVISGGETRTESVRNALEFIKERFGESNVVVAVHDGARPFASKELVDRCFSAAWQFGSAVPVVPVTDSLRRVSGGENVAVDRRMFVCVQTPQCFNLKQILKAYESGASATDDATLYEAVFAPPTLVEGEVENKKITYSSDISEGNRPVRAGVGFDVHPLVPGRKLILGGVEIPFDKGLLGHSDADCLTHAVMDAMLTAAGLPDIGHYFPPSDPAFEGACSLELLRTVANEVKNRGYAVLNVSGVIMAERPKMASFIPMMEGEIAKTLGVPNKNVKFAATTTEKLGIIGEGKGIAAEATVLLERSPLN